MSYTSRCTSTPITMTDDSTLFLSLIETRQRTLYLSSASHPRERAHRDGQKTMKLLATATMALTLVVTAEACSVYSSSWACDALEDILAVEQGPEAFSVLSAKVEDWGYCELFSTDSCGGNRTRLDTRGWKSMAFVPKSIIC
ncbi:hypothetical protein L249_0458 [Ophiocordyceps polyrhachis-furcata BCC 54312]|uniref:Uncharacterized protein n=1 Tax=Ophiocordyceps polyrhachis-furcata BCC 54312 TaxID=1330021 RepID=A0A367LDA8_9HYPO|nr:hypothetical protein L249_0458 [Ophiocordyceps polyrhachis-furcata BCC 54312]